MSLITPLASLTLWWVFYLGSDFIHEENDVPGCNGAWRGPTAERLRAKIPI